MGEILYTDHIVKTGENSFNVSLQDSIKKYQRFGDIELQYQATQYYKDGVTFSCLLICREREEK